MRIVIDIQALQSESKYRGIGSYCYSLISSLVRLNEINKNKIEYILVGNSLESSSKHEIIQMFEGLVERGSILFWDSPGDIKLIEKENYLNNAIAAKVRNYFISALKPDIVFVPSLFEGYIDNVVQDTEPVGTNVPTVCTLFDLIPYLNQSEYLTTPEVREFYFEKVEQLKKANILVGISKSSMNEGKAINVPGYKLDYAYLGLNPSLLKVDESQLKKEDLAKFGIEQPFLLYVGGCDPRKNVKSALIAFGKLNEKHQNNLQFVVAGKVTSGDQENLEKIMSENSLNPEALVFTGHINETELVTFYKYCQLFIFPSWHEGFGLPVLEALWFGAPVLCSNTTSLPEIQVNRKAQFNPHNTSKLSSLMRKALEDNTFLNSLKTKRKQLLDFTYDECAKKMVQIFKKLHRNKVKTYFIQQKKRSLLRFIKVKFNEGLLSRQEVDEFSKCFINSENQLFIKKIFNKEFKLNIEGPFDSTYSLARLNRETAISLQNLGYDVALHSTEGPGDFEPSKDFLNNNKDIEQLFLESKNENRVPDVISRNLYPPRSNDFSNSSIAYFHHYAWEESLFPYEWAEDFNNNLDGISCLSDHVKKVLIDSGVKLPMTVSGCGIDHWLNVKASSKYKKNRNIRRYLHVSSCFQRKGPEVLVKAFFERFTNKDKVELIIKTFPNPHNEIEKIIAKYCNLHPNGPRFTIINEDLIEEDLKSLYQSCDVFVSTTFAEGFGIPFAEALLCDLPVIATGWSGQLDFLNHKNSWLVDFNFEYAQTHFNQFHSVWAVPKINSLKKALSDSYNLTSQQLKRKSNINLDQIKNKFSWNNVAENFVKGISDNFMKSLNKPKIAWISSYKSHCGIATYTDELISCFDNVDLEVFCEKNFSGTETKSYSTFSYRRNWTKGWSDNAIITGDSTSGADHLNGFHEMYNEIVKEGFACVVLQFQHTWYNFSELKTFAKKLKEKNIPFIIEMHNSISPDLDLPKKFHNLKYAEFLKFASRIVVHSVSDLNNLKSLGLQDNVVLIPHGFYSKINQQSKTIIQDSFLISSFGYLLPQKNIPLLIDALIDVLSKNEKIIYKGFHSLFEHNVSINLKNSIETQLSKIPDDIRNRITINYDYQDLDILSDVLQNSDLLVYPYKPTNESSSGAIKFGMRTGVPILASDITIFEEFQDSIFKSKMSSKKELTNAIEKTVNIINENSDEFKNIHSKRIEFCKQTSFEVVSKRYQNMIESLSINYH